MKSNKEILDEFGKLIIRDCFDPYFSNLLIIRNKENPPEIFKRYSSVLKRINNEDFEDLQDYWRENLGGLIFNILRIFEEHEEFKILYEEKEKQINLVEISEMLKAEPIIENGWIKRFSEYGKKDKT